ncbi:MAG: hypothetical protein IH874_07060 [Candidatus Dadabacteria bacterium]|nr:hypothetical protein [Candidatus Dadabacteria bacterium]
MALNGFGNVVDIVELDLRDVSRSFPCRSFDYVITNPPYREPRAGRITPTEQKAIARHEISCSMEDVMDAMKYLVEPRRRACCIYPSRRLPELVDIAGKRGLELKRLRFIHPRPDRGAELFMAELLKDGKPGVEVLPPLFTSEPPRGAGGFSGL